MVILRLFAVYYRRNVKKTDKLERIFAYWRYYDNLGITKTGKARYRKNSALARLFLDNLSIHYIRYPDSPPPILPALSAAYMHALSRP